MNRMYEKEFYIHKGVHITMASPIPIFLTQPPAWFHTRILVGPAAYITQSFVAEHDIRYIINCAFDEYTAHWFRSRYPARHHVLEAEDDVRMNILSWYNEFEGKLREFLQGDGIVYVHCHAGMNRSASLALAYCCCNLGMDVDDLLASVLKQRPCMFANTIYKEQVRQFIKDGQLPSQKSSRNIWNTITGYLRLDTPRVNSEFERDDDFTRIIARGTSNAEGTDFHLVFGEFDREDSDSEESGGASLPD